MAWALVSTDWTWTCAWAWTSETWVLASWTMFWTAWSANLWGTSHFRASFMDGRMSMSFNSLDMLDNCYRIHPYLNLHRSLIISMLVHMLMNWPLVLCLHMLMPVTNNRSLIMLSYKCYGLTSWWQSSHTTLSIFQGCQWTWASMTGQWRFCTASTLTPGRDKLLGTPFIRTIPWPGTVPSKWLSMTRSLWTSTGFRLNCWCYLYLQCPRWNSIRRTARYLKRWFRWVIGWRLHWTQYWWYRRHCQMRTLAKIALQITWGSPKWQTL